MSVAASTFRRLLPMLLILALLPLAPVAITRAGIKVTTWTVSTTKDTATPSAANCTGTTCPTLRDALVAARSGDTVSLAGLSGWIDSNNTPLTITTSLTITAPTGNMRVNGGGYAPTFWLIGTGLAVTINNLTISEGGCEYKPIARAGGLMLGGGILMTAAMTRSIALTLTNTTVSNNPTTRGQPPLSSVCTWGGGIAMDITRGGSGTLTLINSTVELNSAPKGGGILVYGGDSATSGTANVTLKSSLVGGNTNTAGTGGGIDIDGFATAALTLIDSTVSANIAGSQAGIYLAGGGTPALSVINSVIGNNTSTSTDVFGPQHLAIDEASGIWVYASGATMQLIGSFVSNNCSGPITLPNDKVVKACPSASVQLLN